MSFAGKVALTLQQTGTNTHQHTHTHSHTMQVAPHVVKVRKAARHLRRPQRVSGTSKAGRPVCWSACTAVQEPALWKSPIALTKAAKADCVIEGTWEAEGHPPDDGHAAHLLPGRVLPTSPSDHPDRTLTQSITLWRCVSNPGPETKAIHKARDTDHRTRPAHRVTRGTNTVCPCCHGCPTHDCATTNKRWDSRGGRERSCSWRGCSGAARVAR